MAQFNPIKAQAMKTNMTPEQRERLTLEYGVLKKYAPSFRMLEVSSDMFVEGSVLASTGTQYHARVMLPDSFPYDEPALLVISPHPIWTRDHQQTVNSMGNSHAFHTKGADANGFLKLCAFGFWNPSFPIAKVVLKFCVWVEAYENYLKTSETIADFLERKEGSGT